MQILNGDGVPDIQCALGISQLEKIDEGLKRRNQIANKYKEAFKGLIKHQTLPSKSYNAHHLFVIEVENRKGLYDFLREQNIFAQIHYIPIHTLPYYKKIGYEDANLVNSENYYSKAISLPMYPTLSNEEQDFVIKKVQQFIFKNFTNIICMFVLIFKFFIRRKTTHKNEKKREKRFCTFRA